MRVCLNQFSAVVRDSVLKVDAREVGGQLAHVTRGRASHRAYLIETVRGHLNVAVIFNVEREPLRVIGTGIDAHIAHVDRGRGRMLGKVGAKTVKRVERQKALIVGAA